MGVFGASKFGAVRVLSTVGTPGGCRNLIIHDSDIESLQLLTGGHGDPENIKSKGEDVWGSMRGGMVVRTKSGAEHVVDSGPFVNPTKGRSIGDAVGSAHNAPFAAGADLILAKWFFRRLQEARQFLSELIKRGQKIYTSPGGVCCLVGADGDAIANDYEFNKTMALLIQPLWDYTDLRVKGRTDQALGFSDEPDLDLSAAYTDVVPGGFIDPETSPEEYAATQRTYLVDGVRRRKRRAASTQEPAPGQKVVLMGYKEIKEMTGMSRGSIVALMATGKFPQPVKEGRWLPKCVWDWVDDQTRGGKPKTKRKAS